MLDAPGDAGRKLSEREVLEMCCAELREPFCGDRVKDFKESKLRRPPGRLGERDIGVPPPPALRDRVPA